MSYEFLTPTKVWEEYDDELPLSPSETATETVDGIIRSTHYFSAIKTDDGVARCFVHVLRPDREGKLPCLVVAQGPSDFEVENLLPFAKNGFAVVVFDYAGACDGKTFCTMYPDSLSFATFGSAETYEATPSARHTSWYIWSYLARRTVTFARSLPFVDDERIGIIGESEGANIAVVATATDKRISACCAVFGWNRNHAVCDEENECWISGVDPISYAQLIDVPVLVAECTNSHTIDYAHLGAFSTLKKQIAYHVTSIGLIDSLYKNDVDGIHKFFKHTLCGEEMPLPPELVINTAEDGSFEFSVKADNPLQTAVYYAVGEDARFLSYTQAELKDGVAKINAEGDTLFVVGKAYYNDCKLTTAPHRFVLNDKRNTNHRASVLYTPDMGTHFVVPTRGAKTIEKPISVQEVKAVRGITSTTGAIALFENNDASRALGICFDEFSTLERFIKVNVTVRRGEEIKTFSAKVCTEPKDKWHHHVLERHDFVAKDGETLTDFDGAKEVEFFFFTSVLITNVLWI